jgi:hypothetical protein
MCRIVAGLGMMIAAVAGCDSQVGPSYHGEVAGVVRGNVVTSVAQPPASLEATLVWLNPGTTPDSAVGQAVAVNGSFPASFQIELTGKPPEAALFSRESGPRFSVALITALPEGTEIAGDPPAGPLGIAEDHVLVYLEDDAGAGTSVSDLFGGPLEKGYHVMDVLERTDPACGDSHDYENCLRPANDGFQTIIQVRIDLYDNLDMPNWN